jgi:hypothetical protein
VSTEAEPENAFELAGLVVKTKAKANPANSNDNRVAPRPTRRDDKLFSRITEWHWDRLAGLKRGSTIHFFGRLMIEYVKAFKKPFTLRSGEMAVKTGLSRWSQRRALDALSEAGLIKVERNGPRKPPRITVFRS